MLSASIAHDKALFRAILCISMIKSSKYKVEINKIPFRSCSCNYCLPNSQAVLIGIHRYNLE